MLADLFSQNVIWTFAMFWYLIYNRYAMKYPWCGSASYVCYSFDATYLYQYTFIILYNVVFTSLPVIVLGGKSAVRASVVSN